VKKKWTLTLLLVLFLSSFLWAVADLWNGIHLMALVFLLESPWLLAAVSVSLNLYENQPVRPKIRLLLITLSLLGIGVFGYGAFRDSSGALIASVLLALLAGMLSLGFFTPWLKQATGAVLC
jgi:hypothetical protein